MFAPAAFLSFCLIFSACTFFVNAERLQCSMMGQCVNSNLIYEGNAKTRQDCHQKCKNNDDCYWFTYHASQKYCLLYANCGNITESGCDSCVTGEKNCDLYNCRIQGACLVIKPLIIELFGHYLVVYIFRDKSTTRSQQKRRENVLACAQVILTASGTLLIVKTSSVFSLNLVPL